MSPLELPLELIELGNWNGGEFEPGFRPGLRVGEFRVGTFPAVIALIALVVFVLMFSVSMFFIFYLCLSSQCRMR
jgi:hypothetical protein